MFKSHLQQIAQILKLLPPQDDVSVQGISTDTRSLQPGNLFIALIGDNFNGHDFVADAEAAGASAIVASQPIETSLPTLYVADTLHALGTLAQWWRQQFAIPVIGITGSCGKTTTKTMLASILNECGQTLASQGTFNNMIGVPLTLLRMTAADQYAVIEMGANMLGEIAYVANLAKPQVSLITNAAAVHLEGFKSLDNVAREKGAIYQALASDGIAIINADDAYHDYWQQLIEKRQCITFSLRHPADVFASDIQLDALGRANFNLHCAVGTINIQLTTLGEYNVANALAAAAAALAINIPLDAIQAGLAKMQAVAQRMIRYTGWAGSTLLDDSYNANPYAFHAAITFLMQLPPGEKILIMGDMGELGPDAADYHRQIGLQAKTLGVDRFYTTGKMSELASQAFGDGAQHFTDHIELIQTVQAILHPDSVVLIKGSLKINQGNMRKIAEALQQTY